MPFQLNEVIPWGRSFEEYRRMFALSDADLAGRILGCGDGPASFNAEVTALGHAVVSCDPIYAFSAAAIEQRVSDCYDGVIAQARTNQEEFVWDYFRDPDHLGQVRLAVMRRFLADFPAGKAAGRYVTAALPDLPFADGQFDLALVSHLLFLYSEQLDLAFHRAAVEELLRVAREVRIFPLLSLGREPAPHVEPIHSHVRSRGWRAEIALVPYEFQRGGNRMLRIIGREPTAPRPHDDCRHSERAGEGNRHFSDTSMSITIRPETTADQDAIRHVNRLAFGQDEEARLVDALRDGGYVRVLLIAEQAGRIVGHILFSDLPIITGDGPVPALALAPMAVLPEFQRQGIGSALVRRGLEACRQQGHRIVIVLGHSNFYPRFGFSPKLAAHLESPFSGRDSFMALELVPGALDGVVGRVQYPPPFGAWV